MSRVEPLVLEVALNGLTSSEENRFVPRSPAELRADALGCLDAGAAILHAHSPDMRATGAAAARDYLAAWGRSSRSGPTCSGTRPSARARGWR